jgi:hypothetical protein
LELFECNTNDEFVPKGLHENILSYAVTDDSSNILLVDNMNRLSMYSLANSILRWTNHDFEQEHIEVHVCRSLFLLICRPTKSIIEIDSHSLQCKQIMKLSRDVKMNVITSDDRWYLLSSDSQILFEINLRTGKLVEHVWQEILPSKSIEHIHSTMNVLLFQMTDQYVYLCRDINKSMHRFEQASMLTYRQQRLIIECFNQQRLIIYDLAKNLRGTIDLETNMLPSQAMCLTDEKQFDQQYLFVLGHDQILRMFSANNGQQLSELFIQYNLTSLIGMTSNCLILTTTDRLCLVKIIDKNIRSTL